MIDRFSFVNNHWFWYIILATLLVWLVFALKEWRQSNKLKLYLKLALAFIALTSLALIILKPTVISSIDTYEVALLTEGYSNERLDSLKKAQKKLQVQTYKVNESFINPNKTPSTIYILGEGIAPFDFYHIDSLNVTYLGNTTPSGIVKLKYDQEQTLGNSLDIEGLFNNGKKGTKLVLENPAKKHLDSVIFLNDSTKYFKLSTQLNVIGKFEYHLVEKDSTDNVITSNPIGINVIPENTLRILIVNGFPTFETKYLKNFLAEIGSEVVVKSQVTTGKFKYEYFNVNTKPTVVFSEKNLQYFDLVIIDAQSFRNLGSVEKNNLETVVRNEGLGVIIQSISNFNNEVNYLANFSFQSNKNISTTLSKWPKTNISKTPFSLKSQFSLHPIHKTNDKILSAYKPLGNGRIGTSVFENTFQLILNGNTNVYQTLWSETVNALSKKQLTTVNWNADKNIIFKDEPVTFSVRSHINTPKVLNENNDLIPLINDIDNSSLWKGTNYPKKVGWQTHYLQQDSTQIFNYYVADTMHWKALQSFNTIKSNRKQFETTQTENKAYTTQQPISLVWLYVLFLLSIGYLWLEPKL
ncbi:MAG: hypothetical protein DA407_10535 [Bacteroidetes bacterium]|nr:MAG: hypothetical protein DA407_10535 [Bacteroidota bacterium]